MQSTLADSESGELNEEFGTQSLAPLAAGYRDACANILPSVAAQDNSTYFLVFGLPITIGGFNPFSKMKFNDTKNSTVKGAVNQVSNFFETVQICAFLRPCTNGGQGWMLGCI